MDYSDDEQIRSRRENFLAFFLAGLAALGFFVFLTILTGGLIFYMLLVLGVVVVLGFVNYLLWGRAMMRATAGEREEEELRDRADADGWPLPEPRNPRGY